MTPDYTSLYSCLLCGEALDYEAGAVSLTGGQELHVCAECWDELEPMEKLAELRRWRGMGQQEEALKAFTDLARAALDGWHFPGLGQAQRN